MVLAWAQSWNTYSNNIALIMPDISLCWAKKFYCLHRKKAKSIFHGVEHFNHCSSSTQDSLPKFSNASSCYLNNILICPFSSASIFYLPILYDHLNYYLLINHVLVPREGISLLFLCVPTICLPYNHHLKESTVAFLSFFFILFSHCTARGSGYP